MVHEMLRWNAGLSGPRHASGAWSKVRCMKSTVKTASRVDQSDTSMDWKQETSGPCVSISIYLYRFFHDIPWCQSVAQGPQTSREWPMKYNITRYPVPPNVVFLKSGVKQPSKRNTAISVDAVWSVQLQPWSRGVAGINLISTQLPMHPGIIATNLA